MGGSGFVARCDCCPIREKSLLQMFPQLLRPEGFLSSTGVSNRASSIFQCTSQSARSAPCFHSYQLFPRNRGCFCCCRRSSSAVCSCSDFRAKLHFSDLTCFVP